MVLQGAFRCRGEADDPATDHGRGEKVPSRVLVHGSHHDEKKAAEAYLRLEVDRAVVTVPTYLNDSQRQETKVRIVNQQTAAAISYGLDKKCDDEHNELTYDTGGDIFDGSILPNKDDIFEVKAMSMDYIRNSMGPVPFFSQIDRSFSPFPFADDRFQRHRGGGVREPYIRGKTYISMMTWNKTYAQRIQLQDAYRRDGPDQNEHGISEVAAAHYTGQPTVKEHQELMATHRPYRSRCKFCVMGRVNAPHRRSDGQDDLEGVPHISMGCGFLGERESRRASVP